MTTEYISNIRLLSLSHSNYICLHSIKQQVCLGCSLQRMNTDIWYRNLDYRLSDIDCPKMPVFQQKCDLRTNSVRRAARDLPCCQAFRTHTHTHTHTYTHMHKHAQTHTHAHTHTQIHTRTRTHTDTRRHTQTHADTHRHTQTQTYTQTHTHTHTHTHTGGDDLWECLWGGFG